MPWLGNRCPGSSEVHTFESRHCLLNCDHQCVPASVLVHIANKAFVEKHIGTYISATALLGCLRALYLERTEDWYQEPSTSWYSVRGTLLHAILENPDFGGLVHDMSGYVQRLIDKGLASDEVGQLWLTLESDLLAMASMLPKPYHVPDWESEREFEMSLGVIDGQERFLKGTIDVLRPLLGEIIDYKTVGDKSLPYIGKFGAKPEHEMQFNIYRMLVERGYPVGQKDTYKPIKVQKIRAYYMSMMQVIGTGSNMTETTAWTASEPKQFGNEISRVVANEREDLVVKRGKRKGSNNPEDYVLSEKKKYHLTYAIPDVKLLDLDDVFKFVVERATILFRAFDKGIMPPLPPVEMQLWKCDSYCPVKEFCDKVCAGRGEVRAKLETANSSDMPLESEGTGTDAVDVDILPVEG